MKEKLVKKIVDGDEYSLFLVDEFTIKQTQSLVQMIDFQLKKKKLTPVWRDYKSLKYLEKILEYHTIAKKLFETKDVGIVIFINNSEQNADIKEMKYKIGDKVTIAYIEKGWKNN